MLAVFANGQHVLAVLVAAGDSAPCPREHRAVHVADVMAVKTGVAGSFSV